MGSCCQLAGGGRLSPYPGASAFGPERLLRAPRVSLPGPRPCSCLPEGWRERKFGGPKFSGSGCMNQEGQAPLEFERDHLAERCQERRSCARGQAYLPAGLAWKLRRPQRSLACLVPQSPLGDFPRPLPFRERWKESISNSKSLNPCTSSLGICFDFLPSVNQYLLKM